MPNISDLLSNHDRQIDSIVGKFESELILMLEKAKSRILAETTSKLQTSPLGSIEMTAANMRVLSALPKLFLATMKELGYRALVEAYVRQFPGQIAWFQQVLKKTLSELDAESLANSFKLNKADLSFLAQKQTSAFQAIQDVLQSSANMLRQRAVLSVAGLTPIELAKLISSRLGVIPTQATTIAGTSIHTFYRTVAAMGYAKIEQEPGTVIKYKYTGPPSIDPVERPFCKRLMSATESGEMFTRAQIDGMDNLQLPDVFTTGGGWECRHQWVIGFVEIGGKRAK